MQKLNECVGIIFFFPQKMLFSYLPSSSQAWVLLLHAGAGGEMPVSRSPWLTTSRTLWERAGGQLLFIPALHCLGLPSWEENRGGRELVI